MTSVPSFSSAVCPTFDVVHLHMAFAIKRPCPSNCPQSVLDVVPAMEAVFEVTYFCARPCHRHRRRPGNPAAKLQLGTAAGALYLPPPQAALLPAASKWSMPACTMTICPSKPMWQRASGCCLRRTIVLLPAFPIGLPPVTRVHNRCLPHDACDGWEWQANIPLPGSPSD